MGESHKAIGGQRELTHSANVLGKHIIDQISSGRSDATR